MLKKITKIPLYIFAVIFVLIIRLISPLLLVRIGELVSARIGHFAANTELYLCEQDAGINYPKQKHIDIFFMSYKPVCNKQLAIMWKRVLNIWPSWVLSPIFKINRLIPGSGIHEVGQNAQHDRDVHNLLDRFPAHLKFTNEENYRGQKGLEAMGISDKSKFVCLNVRDSAYLNNYLASDCTYHNYRDSNIQNYVLAAEALTEKGYFVIRMGALVKSAINTNNPKIIDYAVNGMRNDFMDVYLGAKCTFCISTSSGFDAIPSIFRRPVVFVNSMPLGYSSTFSSNYIFITKYHFAKKMNRFMTLSEIVSDKVLLSMKSSEFELSDVELIENTSSDIRDAVMEMAERIEGSWVSLPEDESIQEIFWKIFPSEVVDIYDGKLLHGEIRSLVGTKFLRNNPEFLI